MSLTALLDIRNSTVSRFLAEQFPYTRSFVLQQNKVLVTARTVRLPTTPLSWIYGLLGTAIDYRIRYYFPPSMVQNLVAWEGALRVSKIPRLFVDDPMVWQPYEHMDLARFRTVVEEDPFGRTRRTTSDVDAYNSVEHRKYGKVRWMLWKHESEMHLLRERNGHVSKYMGRGSSCARLSSHLDARPPTLSTELILGFFRSLEDTIGRTMPMGRILDTDKEEELARYCIVLSLFEQQFRVGPRIESPLFSIKRRAVVRDLLALAEDEWVQDICAQSHLFFDRCRHLLKGRATLNPTFKGSPDVWGADADLIADDCLIDIKSTINPKLSRNCLYQILGYALLDYDDELGIQEVGIYFARQGVTLLWPLQTLMDDLSGGSAPPLTELRKRFQEVARSIDPLGSAAS